MNKLAKEVADYARARGFEVRATSKGHLCFKRPDAPAVFFSKTPGDQRARDNGVAKLRRAMKRAAR